LLFNFHGGTQQQDRKPALEPPTALDFTRKAEIAGRAVNAVYRHRGASRWPHIQWRVDAKQAILAQVLQSALVGSHGQLRVVEGEQKTLSDLNAVRETWSGTSVREFYDILVLLEERFVALQSV
jgi:hypothetical protein